MSGRVSFTIDDTRAAAIENYAYDHGYASAGDFARVATLRIMSMYPTKKAAPANCMAGGERIAPGVPLAAQAGTGETAESSSGCTSGSRAG